MNGDKDPRFDSGIGQESELFDRKEPVDRRDSVDRDEPRSFRDRNVFQMAKLQLAPILTGASGGQVSATRRPAASAAEVVRYPQAERRLGIGEESIDIVSISLDSIRVGPRQLRDVSEDPELQNLADSIVSKGVLQPVIVRALISVGENGEQFELVAGERRCRAARLAGLSEIPALVRKLTDQEAVEVAIVENAQREDLNPIDEALAFRRLIDEFKMNQSEVARRVGKNRTTVANAVRLLNLHPDVIELLKDGKISAGHGRALLMVEHYPAQIRLAERAATEGLSVRDLESLASRYEEREGLAAEEPDEEARLYAEKLATRVAEYLGIDKVKLKVGQDGHKRMTVVFESEASWKRFVSKIRS
jgi:ParB family chromosome partitioning protein